MTNDELEAELARWRFLATRANMYLDAIISHKIGFEVLDEYEKEWREARRFTTPMANAMEKVKEDR